ncbi:MAG: hypothetical protein U9M91_00095 [Chloroflexota bacterium]|nr:hypothetical protein [Chloroflexota bacterium]
MIKGEIVLTIKNVEHLAVFYHSTNLPQQGRCISELRLRKTRRSVIARVTKPAEAISGMGKRLPRFARNDIRGKA